jgi:hypothetical protein
MDVQRVRDITNYCTKHFRAPKFSWEIHPSLVQAYVTEYGRDLMYIRRTEKDTIVMPLCNDVRVVDVAIDLGGELG